MKFVFVLLFVTKIIIFFLSGLRQTNSELILPWIFYPLSQFRSLFLGNKLFFPFLWRMSYKFTSRHLRMRVDPFLTFHTIYFTTMFPWSYCVQQSKQLTNELERYYILLLLYNTVFFLARLTSLVQWNLSKGTKYLVLFTNPFLFLYFYMDELQELRSPFSQL